MDKKEASSLLIPELRFPEFANDGEWKERKLNDLGEIVTGKTPSTHNQDLWDGDILFITPTDIKEENKYQIITQRTIVKQKNTKILPVGSIVYTCIASIGKIAITTKSSVTNQQINSIVLDNNTNNEFVFYSLVNLTPYIRSKLASSTLPIINKSEFSNFNIKVPRNPREQQKITDCLSSLDELIAAHSKKLEALKAHKRGLLQSLFPAEGELLPKLRFREFVNDGRWMSKTLRECLIKHPDYGINAPAVPYSADLPAYLRITDISEDGNFLKGQMVSVEKMVTDENFLEEGDIVLARTGASVGKSYKYRNKDGKLVFAGFLIRMKPDKKKLDSEFLFQFLFSEQYWHWVDYMSTRSGQPGINGNEYASMALFLPPSIEEQQKIADCLLSLDDLITAQTQKLENLKAHKKGLMQKLFPVIND